MGSFRLFTVRGIDVKVHLTFPLILVWAAVQFGYLGQSGFSASGALFGVVVTLLLFACVVIHELAHSLTSTWMGYPVEDIVLFPLGGVSQIEKMPEGPGEEFLMAVAGPLSNVAIAIVLVAISLFTPQSFVGSLRRIATNPAGLGWQDTLPYLIFTNLGLAVFNLIPAFPMDGGRVLRSLLATVMPHARATDLAVRIGQAFAWLIGLGGLLTTNLVLILIAIFVYSGAAQEGRMLRIKSILGDMRVSQAFSRDVRQVSPDDPVSRAADLTLESFQADFPVCDEGKLVGLLTHKNIVQALKTRRADTPVREVMETEFPELRLDDELFEVHQQMRETGLDALPVIDSGGFAGLLTSRDVNEAYQLLSINRELRRRIQRV
ncbi:MAG: site-2 protease family protein [Anaerolineae bacterium]|jgi:Zn-dependent protease/predicted transcriptional regulator